MLLSYTFIDCSSRAIPILPEGWRCTTKPVPERMRASAASSDMSPEAPLVLTPLTSWSETIKPMPLCLEYAVRAASRSPPGIVKSRAAAVPPSNAAEDTDPTSIALEIPDLNIFPPSCGKLRRHKSSVTDARRICLLPSFRQHDVSPTPRDMQSQDILCDFGERFRIVGWKRAIDFQVGCGGIADHDPARVVAVEFSYRFGKCCVLEHNYATAPTELVAQILCCAVDSRDVMGRREHLFAWLQFNETPWPVICIHARTALDKCDIHAVFGFSDDKLRSQIGDAVRADGDHEWAGGVVLNLEIRLAFVEKGKTLSNSPSQSQHRIRVEIYTRSIG